MGSPAIAQGDASSAFACIKSPDFLHMTHQRVMAGMLLGIVASLVAIGIAEHREWTTYRDACKQQGGVAVRESSGRRFCIIHPCIIELPRRP